MTHARKMLVIALAAALPAMGAQAQTTAELMQQIEALKAQLQALQKQVEQVQQKAGTEAQTVNRIQQRLDLADEQAETQGFKGLTIKGVIDPTFIHTQRANQSDFVAMRDNGGAFTFYNSLYGQGMAEFGKETEDGTKWMLRLTTKAPTSLFHEASVSVPLAEGGSTRVYGGIVPDFSGYEATFAHENPLVTHNLLFDFTAASYYTGLGMSHESGDWSGKWLLGNVDGATGKAVGLAYRVDRSIGEYSGVGFSGVHGPGGNGNSRFDLMELDAYRERGDWLMRAQASLGRVQNGASNGGDASWWGLSALGGYKLTPRLQALVRADYVYNRRNGGGLYGTDLTANSFGPGGGGAPVLLLDENNGFGPAIDNGTGLPIDPNRGVNRYALTTGLNYSINDNASFKVELRYDAATGNVFLDSRSGAYSKTNWLLGGALVVKF